MDYAAYLFKRRCFDRLIIIPAVCLLRKQDSLKRSANQVTPAPLPIDTRCSRHVIEYV
jgi:hypothetical protein